MLGPWQLQMLGVSSQVEDGILATPYSNIRVAFAIEGLLQVILLISIITISVKKPRGTNKLSEDTLRDNKQPEEGLA